MEAGHFLETYKLGEGSDSIELRLVECGFKKAICKASFDLYLKGALKDSLSRLPAVRNFSIFLSLALALIGILVVFFFPTMWGFLSTACLEYLAFFFFKRVKTFDGDRNRIHWHSWKFSEPSTLSCVPDFAADAISRLEKYFPREKISLVAMTLGAKPIYGSEHFITLNLEERVFILVMWKINVRYL